jgi:predicted phage terminase large subunit-like protein
MGCQWGIIDDPTKNRIEAESPTYRERLWEWYTSTFYTRLEKDAAVLITLTRWHEDDLAGRLLKQQETDPNADKWVVVQFPAIAEEKRSNDDKRKFGEALWPNKYDLTALSKIKTAVGTYDWNALYQQQPSNRSGGIIKRYWWRFWQREGQNLPPVSVRKENGEIVECPVVTLPDEFDEQLLSWDMTFKDTKGTDYVVGQPWGRKGADKFLLDQVRARLDFPATIIAVKDMTNRWPGATAKLVEDKANGSAVISTLKHEITGLIPVEPQGSKEARASAASPQIEAGNVYLPHPFNASWVDDFLTELSAFPNAAHDDQVDATSQALNRFSGGFNAWLDFLIDESDRLKRSKDNNQQQLDNIRRLT